MYPYEEGLTKPMDVQFDGADCLYYVRDSEVISKMTEYDKTLLKYEKRFGGFPFFVCRIPKEKLTDVMKDCLEKDRPFIPADYMDLAESSDEA